MGSLVVDLPLQMDYLLAIKDINSSSYRCSHFGMQKTALECDLGRKGVFFLCYVKEAQKISLLIIVYGIFSDLKHDTDQRESKII